MPHGTWSLFHHFIQCFVTSCLLASVCAAPQLPPPAPPEPIPLLQQPYQQDFNDLATQARDVPFPPSQTSLHMGWWASQSTYSTSSGADTGGGGGLFSYGREGSAERALGALTSNQVAYVAWGVSFCLGRHHAGSKKALWALEIAYRGEQWSGGGNKSSMLIFDYSVVDKGTGTACILLKALCTSFWNLCPKCRPGHSKFQLVVAQGGQQGFSRGFPYQCMGVLLDAPLTPLVLAAQGAPIKWTGLSVRSL